MNNKRKISMVMVLLGILIATHAFGDDTSQQRSGRRHHGPPPEAYTACEGKSAGDTTSFESPRGDKVTGTCEQEGDRLVLRPDNPPDRRGRDNAKD